MPPLSYPERVIYPVTGFTKRQVFDYYAAIAPYLLPHLRDRPVTLKRYPDQAQGEYFYEKDAPGFTPGWVKTFGVWRRSGESQIHYILINDARTLTWAAGVGTLEIHPFLARTRDFDSPTEIVFDLDPGDGADILQCGEVAFLLREVLARLDLQSFAKVSGSKGLQVYVPLNSPATYAATQPFARSVAELLASEHPKQVVAAMEKTQRKGKVFIDWSQNSDYKTTVSVYSLRAKRRHPYVSAPVRWEELDRAARDRNPESLYFLPNDVLERVGRDGDLFAPVLTLRQRLPEAFVRESPAPRKRVVRQRPSAAPKPSAQGGRRSFVLLKEKNGLKLILQMHEVERAWTVAAIPRRAGQVQPARCTSAAKITPQVIERASDHGTVELIEGNPAKGYLDLWFEGKTLQGEYILRGGADWEFIKPVRGKKYATEAFLRARRSAKTLTTPSPTGRKPKLSKSTYGSHSPSFITPMECKLVTEVPAGDGWLYELKLDGYRIVGVKDGARATIYSRHGNPFNDRFPAIATALRNLSLEDCILDGEIVALDAEGRPSFQELQNSRSTRQPIVYYVFDLLHLAGRDLHALPLSDRKQHLEKLASSFREPVRLAAVLSSDALSLVNEVKRLGLEGVVAKRADSRYEAGKRSGAWVKYRVNEREEFVVGGYLPGRTGLDALLVGSFRGQNLHFVKKVRNGFVPATRQSLLRALRDLKQRRCPFVNLPEPASRRGAVDAEQMQECVWVRPERKAEIEFAERTAGERLRHAAFRKLV